MHMIGNEDDVPRLPNASSNPVKDSSMATSSADEEVMISLDSRAQAMIGQRLKAVYSELVQQPVPDHLLKLLEELEQQERQR